MPYSIRGLACLSILPFFEDLQVIPKKEGSLFPPACYPKLDSKVL
jgi:hypothetical protein